MRGGGPMSGHDLRRAEINRRRAAARARIAGNGHLSTAGRVADQCRRAGGRAVERSGVRAVPPRRFQSIEYCCIRPTADCRRDIPVDRPGRATTYGIAKCRTSSP